MKSKKILTSLLVAVLGLTISVNAQSSTFVDESAKPEEVTSIKANLPKVNASTIKKSRAATCVQKGNTEVCTDVINGFTVTLVTLENGYGAMYSLQYKSSDLSFKYYFNTKTVTNDPAITKVNIKSYWSSGKTNISQIIKLRAGVYKLSDIQLSTSHYSKFTSFTQYRYNSVGRKTESIYKVKSSKGYITKLEEKTYGTNRKLATKYLVKRNLKGKIIMIDSRTYYSTGKRRNVLTRYKNSKGVNTKAYRTLYRSTGKRDTRRKLVYSSGKAVKMYEYRYNRSGALKSTKKSGNAYKVIYTINKKKQKVTKIIRAKYNSKGKLGKYYRVKSYSKVIYF